jgi:hypothetical protein
MMMKLKSTTIPLLAAMALLWACSDEDIPNYSGPDYKLRGKVSVTNSSMVLIEIVEYTHFRGTMHESSRLGIRLFPEYTYFLHNLIDEGDQQMFEGGDLVRVQFKTVATEPGEQEYQNTVEILVNGSYTIHVKGGGEYSISPG